MFNRILIFCVLCFFSREVFSEEGVDWEFLEEQEDISPFNPDLLDEEEFTYNLEGMEDLQKDRMPKHVSFIMDGNRRWAKERGISTGEGHSRGAETVMKLIRFFCTLDLGIETFTLYTFSTENWGRSEEEVEILMNLIDSYFEFLTPYLKRYSLRLKTIGDSSRLPLVLQEKIRELTEYPIENPKRTLVLALNYGGRDEITRAFSKMAFDLEKGLFEKEEISEELVQSYLDTASIGDPDLLIRTSGELRISNFLLWQLAYAEFYFSPSYWPDFSEQELVNILLEFQKRKRRFGGGDKPL